MSNYVIVTDSCSDLPAAMIEEMGLPVIYLNVLVDGKTYTNYPDWREISAKDFYDLMRAEKTASTSAASMGSAMGVLEPLLQAGKDVLYLGFYSALSSTDSTTALAAGELMEQYPGRKILCVDTLCASLGQGLFVRKVWELQQAGASLEEAYDYACNLVPHLCHWFTVNDLHALQRGGRVSKTTAVIGSALQIKPVLHVDDGGHLTKLGTVRGRKNSLASLKDKLKAAITDPEEQTIYISHGDCEDEARLLADMIAAEVPVKGFVFNHVGPVIGAHTGAGVIALFCEGTAR